MAACINRIASWYTWCLDKVGIQYDADFEQLVEFDNAFAQVISGGVLHGRGSVFHDFNPEFQNHFYFYVLLLSYAGGAFDEAGDSDFDPDCEYGLLISAILGSDVGVYARAAHLGFTNAAFPNILGGEPVEASLKDQTNMFTALVVSMGISSSTIFFTDDGLMGLAKSDIEAGDQLCALYGGSIRFILRRDDIGKHWCVVGTAFVDIKTFNNPEYWETGKEEWFSLI